LTASSDKTCRIWDTDTGTCVQTLEGHEDEIFSAMFNYSGDTIITGSKDNTCKIWRDDGAIGGGKDVVDQPQDEDETTASGFGGA